MADPDSFVSADKAFRTSTSGAVLAWANWKELKRRSVGSKKENLDLMGTSGLKDMRHGTGSGRVLESEDRSRVVWVT
jgi:hypothetical protein